MKQILLLVFVFTASLIYAQQGTISGIILDGETAETMISVPVIVVGTEIVRTTDLDGKYSVQLDPGTYDLKFTYIGYQDKVVTDIIVRANEITDLDILMTTSTLEMEEVVVTAKAIERTENALMMLQRKSDKIQDGISSQEMSRMAAGTVAAAMNKITGTSIQDGKYVVVRGLADRYSLSQLNGLPMPSIDPYRNSAQLDMLPTRLLDNIITTKTFTPDQPGTFTGGNVDINTKSFPEKETFSIGFSLGYNSQNNLRDDFLTYEGGENDYWGYGKSTRNRPEILSSELFKQYGDKNAELKARFGDSLSAAVINDVASKMSFQFDTSHGHSFLDHGISLSYGNSFPTGRNSSLGLILSSSFKQEYEHHPQSMQASWFVFDIAAGDLMNSGYYTKTESSLNPVVNGFGGIAYKFSDFHQVDLKLMYNHNARKGTVYLYGEDGNNIIAPSYKLGRALSWQERGMINYQLTGAHHFPTLGEVELEWRTSIVEATCEEPNNRFFSSQYNAESNNEGIPLANVNDPFYFWRTLSDDIKVGAADISIPFYKKLNEGNKIKVGGLLSRKDRDFDEYRYIVTTSQNAVKYTGDFETFFGDNNTGLIRVDKGSNGANKYIIGNFINEATRIENSYKGHEMVSAVYAMVTISPVDKLKLIGGVRMESTDIFVQSKIVDIIGEIPDSSNTGSIDAMDFLPSINIVYSLNDAMNLRAGYTQTLARPNLREIAPFASFDPLIDEFFIGNPDLVTTDIRNVDLRWEWFLQPGELMAISAFYKSFDNPISLQYLNSSNPEFQFTNVRGGTISGLEFEIRKSLAFIDAALENFKITANLALITSSMDVIAQSGLEPEERPFEGQSPVLSNITLGYVEPVSGLDCQLAYNYTGDRLAIIGRESPDIYERAFSSLDAIISKTFGNVSFRLAAGNLLNSKYTTSSEYQGTEYLTKQYTKGRSFSLSVALEL